VYLCDFSRIVLVNPVDAKTNNVPWFRGRGLNGNRFIGLGLRSLKPSDDTGAIGAIDIDSDIKYAPHDNLFLGTWYEYLHPPTDGTLFSLKGGTNVIADTQFFDCSQESGATGTSFIRLGNPTLGSNNGGNIIRGYIPGKGTSALTSLGTGIDVRQSRNRIEGIRGYRENNITIASGVEYTYVHLGGRESGVAGYTAFVDNSGKTSNVLIDTSNGSWEQNVPFELQEIADPTAPLAANKARLYVRDNGAGKTQLVVRFPTGAVQVISTEV
jgi:hypothetical protein